MAKVAVDSSRLHIFEVYDSDEKIVSFFLTVSAEDSRRLLVGLTWLLYPSLNKSLRPGLKVGNMGAASCNLYRLRWRKGSSAKTCWTGKGKQARVHSARSRRNNTIETGGIGREEEMV